MDRIEETLGEPDTAHWGDVDDMVGPQIAARHTERQQRASRLTEMYRPPFEIISRLPWDQARKEGKENGKLLLVNVQDLAVFDCMILNRDLWKDEAVVAIIKESFIFLQYSRDDPSGISYVDNYFSGSRDLHDAYPHIAIVDPHAGDHLMVWPGSPIPKSADFMEALLNLIERYSLSRLIPRPESTVSVTTVSSSTALVPSIPFGDPHARLDTFFDDRVIYTDSEILEISSLLKHSHSENAWNKVPRTYIVLRVIGQLDVLNKFIELGFSDEWFPVTSQSVPQILKASARGDFVNAQDRILTKSINLEKSVGGRHLHFAKGEPIPFKSVSILGSGNFGQVDRVVSLVTYKEYARKCIPRRTMFSSKTAAAIKLFSDEISVLKRLKHRHMVEFIGSYTDAKYLALLMSPIAEMDFDKYLQGRAESRAAELRTFFGCLATALQYLHDNDIRHKVS
jgi:hypothetical protein